MLFISPFQVLQSLNFEMRQRPSKHHLRHPAQVHHDQDRDKDHDHDHDENLYLHLHANSKAAVPHR